jgi:DNA repair protein RadA/Sms
MSRYVCTSCEYVTQKWVGKCFSCNSWNSLKVEGESCKKNIYKKKPKSINQIEWEECERIKTQIGEIDRVFGGGMVIGSLTLLGGEPGVGKSTFMGELIKSLPTKKTLYVSGEESEQQVAGRMKRIGATAESLGIICENKWEVIQEIIKNEKPEVLILDSIQTIYSEEIQSAPGAPSQVREVTFQIMNEVKAKNITCIVVGQITKDGGIAGPKMLEHMVDTVVYIEGDKDSQIRMFRTTKNRFGMTNEIGLFRMDKSGLSPVVETYLEIDEQNIKTSGCVITSVVEGSRTLLIELQALVSKYDYGTSRRNCEGFDGNRLNMIVAVMEKYLKIKLSTKEIFINVTGGLKIRNGECDLSVMTALLSSSLGFEFKKNTLVMGEIGLSGEIRDVPNLNERISVFERMGVKRLIVPYKNKEKIKGNHPLEIIGFKRVEELFEYFKETCA